METVFNRLNNIRLVPVVKIEEAEKALPLAQALRDGGLPCMEITFRTGCAAQAIRCITDTFSDMLVGAGTVLTTEQARQAAEAGAQFIVSPGLNPAVVRWCVEHGIPVIPGCVTPSDVETALSFGLNVVKFFPAENAGGLGMIKALSAPYGQIQFMPTGGINEKNLPDYLANPNVLACGGSWMVREGLIRSGDFEGITKLCRRAVSLISGAKPSLKNSAVSFPVLDKARPLDALGFGELLLRLSAEQGERIASGGRFRKFAGGAELNVMAGLAQLGLHTGILSRLAANPMGDYIRGEAQGKGVDCRYLQADQARDARTGLYFYEQGDAPRKPTVVYDRKNSSFTGFSAQSVPQEVFESTKLFYTSGISMACSPHCRNQVDSLLRSFKEAGGIIAFDVNYRESLWSEEKAREAIESILPLVDILFVSEESSRRMFHKTGSLEDILRSYCTQYGISVAATTQRTVYNTHSQTFGSLIYGAKEDAFFTEPPYEGIEVVDRIGSGDAFVSGVLYGILERRDLRSAVSYGNAACAAKCTVGGDLPCVNRSELDSMIRNHFPGAISSEMNR
jgi:2-dehydro-3-deoxygluconokinase